MTRQLTKKSCITSLVIPAILMFTLVACSSSSDLATQLNGQWRNEQGSDTVNINLTKETSSLTIDGHTFTGAVEKMDKGNCTVSVKVAADGGSPEVWTLQQVWNDNGSAFKLKLRRNGTTETFIPVGHS